MGAGAGYTIELSDVRINGNVQVISFEKIDEDSNTMFNYDVVEVMCNVPIIGSVRAESYMYGCDWIKDVPMTVHSIVVNFMQYDNAPEVTESDILDILKNKSNYIGSGVYGGGWSHSTFDGEFDIRPDNDYSNDINEVTISIDAPNIVNFIDLAVTGDNKEYSIVLNGDPVGSFEDQDEAIDQLDAWIRDDISENGIDSIDFSECFVEELYWQEDVNGEIDVIDPWYDNIVYRVDPADFEDFAEVSEEIDEEFANPIDEDFDI